MAVLETPVFASTSLWEALKMRNMISAAARFSSLYSDPRGMVSGGGDVVCCERVGGSRVESDTTARSRLRSR